MAGGGIKKAVGRYAASRAELQLELDSPQGVQEEHLSGYLRRPQPYPV
jgi:hypothetical protein